MTTLDITPVAKPRMTRRDKWELRPCVARYRAFGDELRLKLGAAYRLPEKVTIVFEMPIPLSWSAKKKDAMVGQPHQQRPDIDNLAKAVLDHLANEDGYVWHLDVVKVWSYAGRIHISGSDNGAGKPKDEITALR